jgi:zinc protease
VLSGGESSRLNQRLVRHDHLAIAAGGVTEALEDPGLFIVYAGYLPNRDAGRVEAALSEEIARVRDKPIGADELDKAKNQLAAGFVFGLQTVDGVAQELGSAQYVEGDWHRFVEGATRYLAVTAADVQRVARKYLVDANLTRVTLAPPAPTPGPTPGPSPAAGHAEPQPGAKP